MGWQGYGEEQTEGMSNLRVVGPYPYKSGNSWRLASSGTFVGNMGSFIRQYTSLTTIQTVPARNRCVTTLYADVYDVIVIGSCRYTQPGSGGQYRDGYYTGKVLLDDTNKVTHTCNPI